MIGQTISHYKILEKLGEGGMGVVYKAQDTKLDRLVALKFLPHHLTANDSNRARLMQEAKAAATLNHPNICTIYGIHEESGEQFIEMEYVDGKSLRDSIANGKLTIENCLAYAIQIGEALQEAHSKGIIHRDIKADNVMVNSKNQIKVMDFGLAKLKGSLKLTKTSSTLGTLAYMAPEQIQGGEVDARSDIFAFGVLLFEMLSGRLPFRGEHEAAMMYSIMNEEPQPIQQFVPDVSPELNHILNRALEKQAEDRYQSVNEFVIDLRRLKKESTRVSRASMGEMPIAPKKVAAATKRTIAAAAVGVLVLVTAVLLAIFQPWSRTPSDSAPSAKDKSIAVMYFENRTGEKDLERILVDLLTTNLSRSKELDVVSSQRLYDILKQIGKQDAESIDKSTASEVAKRAQVKTMLMGSIIKIGSSVRITAQLLDVGSGNIVGSDQVEGQKVEEVFAMVDALTPKVLEKLHIAAETQQLKIADVTTSSFEAYRFYQKGMQYYMRFESTKAAEQFQKATEADSTFAMAYLYVALMKANFGISLLSPFTDPEPHRARIRRAQQFALKATEKERKYIDAVSFQFAGRWSEYHSLVEQLRNEFPFEKTYWQMVSLEFNEADLFAMNKALALDSTDPNTHNMLGYLYAVKGEDEKATTAITKYAALIPDAWNAFDSQWEVYMLLGQYDKAYASQEEAFRSKVDILNSYNRQVQTLILGGDSRKALERIARIESEIPTDAGRLTAMRLHYLLNVHEENLGQTISILQQRIDLLKSRDNWNGVMLNKLDLGKTYAFHGKWSEAEKSFAEAFEASKQAYTGKYNPLPPLIDYFSGIAAAKRSDATKAQKHLESLNNHIQKENLGSLFLNYSYLLESTITLLRQKPAEALALAEKVDGSSKYASPQYFLIKAQAFNLLRDRDKAVQLYRQFLNRVLLRSYGAGDGFHYFLEHAYVPYFLGKIYEEQGNKQLAIESYAKALQNWKNADHDFPELRDAKARLAKLQR